MPHVMPHPSHDMNEEEEGCGDILLISGGLSFGMAEAGWGARGSH